MSYADAKKVTMYMLHRGIEISIFLVFVLYISLIWLSLPYFQSSGGIALWHGGFAESLVRNGPFHYPPNIAYPDGAPIVFGASLSYLQYVFMQLFGIDAIASYFLVGTLFAFIALFGCYWLARGIGTGKALSLALAVAFLSQTFFAIHIKGYGATGYGFALLPAFCAYFQHMTVQRVSLRIKAIFAVAMCGIMIFFAFLDGYTFVMALACGVCFTAANLFFDADNMPTHLVNICILSLASAIAFILYKAYIPSEVLPDYSLDAFATLSLHLPSLLWPTAGFSPLFDTLGLSADRDPASYVGAGLGNHETVFLSFTAIILGLVSFRTAVSNTWRAIAALMILGGFIMAVGPVIPESNGIVGVDGVMSGRTPLMPNLAYPLYTRVPGLDQMRATYRWIAVVKLGLWILVCLVCARLARRSMGEKVLAFVLVLLLLLEGSANPFFQWTFGRQQLAMAENLRRDLVGELVEHLPPKSRLLVLPITNDFVVHSVAAAADISTYNVAGDKNLLLAESKRSDIISRIAEVGPCFLRDLVDGAQHDQIDVVAFRMFDSHRGRYGWIWPPSAAEMEENRLVALELSRNVPEAAIEKGTYFWFIDARRIDRSLINEQCESM